MEGPAAAKVRPFGAAAQTELRSLGLERGGGFKYVFDMGDDLVHALRVLQVDVPRAPGASYPRVVKTVGEAPPLC